MRGFRVLPVLAVLLVATTFASVFASGYSVGVPLLGTTGAPALSGSQFTGIMTVLYADGKPVALASNSVTLYICSNSVTVLQSTGCVTIRTTLEQTAPGTYAYSFTPPSSLTGTITIMVPAGALADENGKIFPAVGTQIGTYATPGLTSSSPALTDRPALPANPVLQQSDLMREAVAFPQPTHDSPVGVVLIVIILLVSAGALMILPRRR